jgi:hypothetical protein
MDGQGIEDVQANLAIFTEAFADLQSEYRTVILSR